MALNRNLNIENWKDPGPLEIGEKVRLFHDDSPICIITEMNDNLITGAWRDGEEVHEITSHRKCWRKVEHECQ